MGILEFFRFGKNRKDVLAALKAGGTIVDVRQPSEYKRGHANGAINIPLNTIKDRAEDLRSKAPIISCCRSGARSGEARSILVSQGIECYNGGSWQRVRDLQEQ